MKNSQYKILLIEDDKIDQMAFERLVSAEMLSYDYSVVETVKDAEKMLENRQFDLVIADYMLKDGTAFEILDLIKGMPVVFTTGAGNEKLAVKAMKAGAYDYLIKNSDKSYLDVLPLVVENAINHARMEQEVKRYHEQLEELVKKRTEQLEQEKELLSVTFSSMTDGVVVTDAVKNVVLLNKVAEKLLGVELDNVRGCPLDDILQLYDEKSREPLENPVNTVLVRGAVTTRREPCIIIQKDGSIYSVCAAAAPICKNADIVRGVVMLIHDLSQEQEIDRMKTDFVSSISHELRTPLTSIKAFTETILRDTNMSEKIKNDFLIAIDEQSNRLAELVNGLLEISQLQSENVCFVEQDFDITEIADKIISSLRHLADQKKISLELSTEKAEIWYRGDESRINSLFTNLINNAIKFTMPEGVIKIEILQKGRTLLISVSDTGIGIPKEELPKIFSRFYRVKQNGKQIPGTGLGLAIVNEVAVLHGGEVQVESEPGRGTKFTVSLPIKQPSEKPGQVLAIR